jgi:nucleotide-binding universal stress UspA family protein
MRVLIAHDGSPGADVGVALTASLPLPAGSVIRLIAAIEGDLAPLSASEPTSDPPAPAMVDLRVPLEAAARRLQRPGVTIDHVVRRGDPSMVIAAEAETLRADLVVVGSRGLGRIRTLLVGSVAAAVVDTSPCPVLVARIPRMSKVLLATDGSVPSAVATDRLAQWSIFEDVPILVLSVATSVPQYGDPPSGSGMQEIVQTARQQKVVDAAAVPLLEAGRRVIPRVRTGDAAAQIVSYGHGQSVDLIVVGSRGRTGLTRTLLGSVARGVLASARTSVLIVRPMPSSREDPAMRFTSQ